MPCCDVASLSLCSHWALSWLNLSSSSSFSLPQFLSPICSWDDRRTSEGDAQTSEYWRHQRFRFDSHSSPHLPNTLPASLDPSQPRRTQPGGAGALHAPSSAPPSGPQVPARHWQTKRLQPLFLFLSQAGQKQKDHDLVNLACFTLIT